MFNTCITQYRPWAEENTDGLRMSLPEILRHDPNEFDLGLEVQVSESEI